MSYNLLALLLFIVFTIIFFIIKYVIFSDPFKKNLFKNPPKFSLYLFIYLTAVVATQFMCNLGTIKDQCGSLNYGGAVFVTFAPWVFIFGLMYTMLTIFPSWKMPFSNTFGYLVAKIFGIRKLLLENILIKDAFKKPTTPPTQIGGTKIKMKGGFGDTNQEGGDKMITEALDHIYSDPSLIINEITNANFTSFWEKINPLLQPGADTYMDNLYNLVLIKDITSEFIWYMLTGLLIVSISSSNIANTACYYSVDQMKKNHQDYEDNMSDIDSVKSDTKVYKTTE
jgi:hypothetical protein